MSFHGRQGFLQSRGRIRLGHRQSLFGVIVGLMLGISFHAALCHADEFNAGIRPVLAEYCVKCHSTEKLKGDLDLEVFSSLEKVRKHPKIWQTVLEQLGDGEMPPKDKPQPSVEQKRRLTAWVRSTLDVIAMERAGDPGQVVLRRLSNAEYTYTLRDLTGVDSLVPAREFPVDGAAGEGFTNTGQALVMSPSLVTKYLDAGKGVAGHLVLLPDGIRFSTKATRRDWTNETLADIRELYAEFSSAAGGDKVNLQGIAFSTNEGGRLPLEQYLEAAIALRDSGKTVDQIATERRLSAKYLGILLTLLNGSEPSPLLDNLRKSWKAAKPGDSVPMAAEVAQWQRLLWKFGSVGHIGKAGGPKAWMEPVTPLVQQQEFKFKLVAPANGNEIAVYLTAGDAGDGSAGDFVVWRQPRLVIPGRPPLLLRDVREFVREMKGRRERIFSSTAKALAAAVEAGATPGDIDTVALAQRHEMDADVLAAWFDYLGIGSGDTFKLDHFTEQISKSSDHEFVKGWGSSATPLLLANSSDQLVRIPGNLKAHGIVVHPSTTLQAAVGWLSPVTAVMRIEGVVTHAHPLCGNGVAWSLELRRGRTRQRLAGGVAEGGKSIPFGPLEKISVQKGDLVSLLIDPRNGDYSCDLTDLELKLSSTGEAPREWSLSGDVSGNVLAGNPHADQFGNEGVWHFYTEPVSGGNKSSIIPEGSLLARWQSAANAEEKSRLSEAVQKLLTTDPPSKNDSPDGRLHQQMTSLAGPLFAKVGPFAGREKTPDLKSAVSIGGPDPLIFGRHPGGAAMEPGDLCVQAPSVVEIRLPADLFAGAELVTTGGLDKKSGIEGSVQLQVLTSRPDLKAGLLTGVVSVERGNVPWTSDNRMISNTLPIIANEGSAAYKRIQLAFDEFRRVFPPALCYTKIVPVDEVVTLTLFHREDEHLAELMLDDARKAKLDRLWDELHFVSQDALTLVDAFEQIWQFATQDADPKVFEPMRKPILEKAAAFRQQLIDREPKHVAAVLEFAERAYRRPLSDGEKSGLRGLYKKFREQEQSHDDSIRLMIARVLVSPAFLYRAETPGAGVAQVPVNDWELATRLSYFLWSSEPDAELLAVAASGKLHEPDVLVAQAHRMMGDARVRRLATEFACQWLHIYDFDTLDEKSERHFPTFVGLREAMYEESIRFFTDFFRQNGSVLGVLDADHTFLNEALAKHYGIPGVTGPQWRRVDGIKKYSRGGILGQATTLAKQSGASRTSPILRGNWVAEVLLGDKLPRPPKDVPRLPEDESTEGLTMRQLTEKHTSDPRCAGCHVRIDAFGFALEGFDAIGRRRDKDLGNRPIDTRAKVMDGTELSDITGLRGYLLNKRRDAYLRQFCRKLLGYSLGRAVQLSDEPLLKEIQAKLTANDYHVSIAIEMIVQSRQFRDIRGRDVAFDE